MLQRLFVGLVVVVVAAGAVGMWLATRDDRAESVA